jgi:hypothetical protein
VFIKTLKYAMNEPEEDDQNPSKALEYEDDEQNDAEAI